MQYCSSLNSQNISKYRQLPNPLNFPFIRLFRLTSLINSSPSTLITPKSLTTSHQERQRSVLNGPFSPFLISRCRMLQPKGLKKTMACYKQIVGGFWKQACEQSLVRQRPQLCGKACTRAQVHSQLLWYSRETKPCLDTEELLPIISSCAERDGPRGWLSKRDLLFVDHLWWTASAGVVRSIVSDAPCHRQASLAAPHRDCYFLSTLPW